MSRKATPHPFAAAWVAADAGEISRFVDFLLSSSSGLQLDATRLYVTGHSMGGAGALVAATTKRFAAVVPVAPAGSVRPAELRGVPLWGAPHAPLQLAVQLPGPLELLRS